LILHCFFSLRIFFYAGFFIPRHDSLWHTAGAIPEKDRKPFSVYKDNKETLHAYSFREVPVGLRFLRF